MKTLLQKSFGSVIGILTLLLLSPNLFGQFTPACSPGYSSGSSEWLVNQITVGDLSQSIDPFLHDYTAQSFSVAAGEPTTMSLTSMGWTGLGIAVDFNNDGDFNDPGEILDSPEYVVLHTNTYIFDLVIPASTLPGEYRFRVWSIGGNSGDGNPVGSPCGSYGYGSWFDVTMEVTSAATCQVPSNIVISNVESTTANAAWDASTTDPESYDWKLHYTGDDPDTDPEVESGNTTELSVSLSDLNPGTGFIFYVRANCGGGDFSLWSNPASINTLCDGTPTPGTPTSNMTSVCGDDNFILSIDEAASGIPGFEFQWQSSPEGENDWTDLEGETGQTYSSTQNTSTDYRYIVTCTGSDMSANSDAITISQNPANECYCTPGFTATNFNDIITNVTFAGINNSSSGSEAVDGYSDFTQSVDPAVVLPQTTYDFSAQIGPVGIEHVGVWIDYNANGVFDEDEYTFVGSGSGNGTVSTQITIPFDAVPGETRMRVRLRWNTAPGANNPCGGYDYGETEDYKVTIQSLEACSGTPEPGLAIASTESVCAGGELVNFSLENDYTTFSEIDYQWQINTGDGWSDLENNTSPSSAINVTETASFRGAVTCIADGSIGYSEAISVTVVDLPEISVSPSSFALCEGGSAVLNASGAATYQWSPEEGLTTNTGASVQASPTTSTQYTVTGTSSVGCVNTTVVTVSPVQEIPVSVTTNETGFCDPGQLVIASLNNVPEGISGGGSWSFEWVDGDGNVVQPYSPISNFATTPTENGYYSYTVNMVASSCNTDTVFGAASISFMVGFGADADITQINCNNPLGSIALENGFGITSDSTYFENDFSEPMNSMDGEIFAAFGNTHIADGRLVLTASQTSTNGRASFYVYPPASVSTMDVHFDLTADQPIDNWGTGGADGLAYSFGDDVETVATDNLANGTGSKLRLVFDAAENTPNLKGIYLMYGYTEPAAVPPNSSHVYGYSSNMNWKIQQDVPVHLHIDQFGKATVTVGGELIFNEVQLPEEFVSANKDDWFSHFTAATGGDALRQAIDNVEIIYGSHKFGIAEGSDTQAPSQWQFNTSFDNLEAGTYHIWMSNEDLSCTKQVGTYTISDINPEVSFNSPINMCEGDSVVLNAQNEGAEYMWNTGETTQIITVDEAGSYTVLVTDSSACTALGSIAVNVTPSSSVDGIESTHLGGGEFTFTAINPTSTDTYSWDFGDDETQQTSIPTVSHTYANGGNYTVSVNVSSAFGCEDGSGSTSVEFVVGLQDIAQNAGISIYPNPASDRLYLKNEGDALIRSIEIMDATGKRVDQIDLDNKTLTQIDINKLDNGIYIMMISTDQQVYNTKFVVTK